MCQVGAKNNILTFFRCVDNVVTLTKVALLRESLRPKFKRLVPRWLSGNVVVGLWFWLCENRLATVALALRACVATGISLSPSSTKKMIKQNKIQFY